MLSNEDQCCCYYAMLHTGSVTLYDPNVHIEARRHVDTKLCVSDTHWLVLVCPTAVSSKTYQLEHCILLLRSKKYANFPIQGF